MTIRTWSNFGGKLYYIILAVTYSLHQDPKSISLLKGFRLFLLYYLLPHFVNMFHFKRIMRFYSHIHSMTFPPPSLVGGRGFPNPSNTRVSLLASSLPYDLVRAWVRQWGKKEGGNSTLFLPWHKQFIEVPLRTRDNGSVIIACKGPCICKCTYLSACVATFIFRSHILTNIYNEPTQGIALV